MVNIDESLQDLIVDVHNDYRNEVAGGEVDHLKPACRMATMEWDEELAKLAALNVRQCKMKHDECRNTENFKHSGQNLAILPYKDEANSTELIDEAITLWFEENEDVEMKYIDKYPSDYDGP